MTVSISWAIAAINGLFLVASGVFVLLMMLHITGDVFLRALFNGTIHGTLEVVSFYYMVCLVFLPLGYIELKREHIRVDLFVQHMPQPLQVGLYVLSCLLGLVFFGMLGWQSLKDAWEATLAAETTMANFTFYIWPSRWALPVGFSGLCLAIFSNLLRAIAARSAL